jgi:hypothetical protein
VGRQVIGGVVGAAIGFVVSGFNPTGAYYGWVIGAAVGASTEVIKQPGIGDLASASAGEGGSRARVYGSFRPIGGQLVWDGGPREIRKRSSGKGGPRVESSIILRSYAIGVCEGPVTGISRVWRDNELVWDSRTGVNVIQSDFATRVTFYDGSWDQLPDPTIEAALGVDEAPYMRGTAYFVITDEDLTDRRGAVPFYQMEAGNAGTVPAGPFIFGPVISGGSPNFYLKTNDPSDWSGDPIPLPSGISSLVRITQANRKIWMASPVSLAVSSDGAETWTLCSGVTPREASDAWWNGSYYYYNDKRSLDGITWEAIPNLPSGSTIVLARKSDGLVASWSSPTFGQGYYWTTIDNGANWTQSPNYLSAPPTRVATDGSRILFNVEGIRQLRTDDVFVTASIASGLDTTYGTYYGSNVFIAYGPSQIWNMGNGESRDVALSAATGGSNYGGMIEGNGEWAVALSNAGTTKIYYSSDNGSSFTEVASFPSASATPDMAVAKDTV